MPATPTAVEATVIARHTTLKGDLQFEGPAVIAGRVEGSITSTDALEIAPEGSVEGEIHAAVIDIHGSVKGKIVATHTCRLGATARVSSELQAANLAMAEGACFVGKVWVGGPQNDSQGEEEAAPVGAMASVRRFEVPADEAVEAESAEPAMIGVSPTVRMMGQTVAPVNRGPKIIKAR